MEVYNFNNSSNFTNENHSYQVEEIFKQIIKENHVY